MCYLCASHKNKTEMNIRFEKTGNVSAELTITLNKEDYEERVTKALKDLRKKANMPGFRPGQAPIGVLKKRFGEEVTVEQVNHLLGEKLYEYIRENKINTLGEPLPNVEKQKDIDFNNLDGADFVFDIALAPEFDARLSNEDEVDYYNITVGDEAVDNQVKMYANRSGEYKKVEEYQSRDMLKGTMTELAEGGLVVEDVVMMPEYMKNDGEKAKFDGAKVNGSVEFNPSVAYEGNQVELSSMLKITKEEAAEKTGDFRLDIKEITRYEPAAVEQALFDEIFGEGAVSGEEEFRARIKADLEAQYKSDSDYKFSLDLRTYLMGRIGTLEFPDEMLKRIIKQNSPEKEDKDIEENYEKTKDALAWQLVRGQLAEQFAVQVKEDDVRETAKQLARMQFAQYGMTNLSDEVLVNYAEGMLKDKRQADNLVDRTVERMVVSEAMKTVKLNEKQVSIEEFNKMFEEKAEEQANG